MLQVPVHEAKNRLTVLRREAATGKEFLLADAKRKDGSSVSLISTDLLDELCETRKFTYEWIDQPGGKSENYSLYNVETGVYGVGPTRLEAVEDFIDNILDYAQVYFADLPYYLSPSGGRRGHYWYLRRVLRCAGDREKLFCVLDLEKVLVN
ncbi:MAG: hypothetical protein A4E52_00064 [Pelotomaculum sp. PtaB.Bin013]|uniref:Uncharacterized protein n=1 Tax=Pelotomaculum isophthalicicum JI TaxID=947010 RepID=A0A9X4H702_9FIRM|nr:hypothetical protein [Pelotomaculum isophthalicicum]MDF9409503.1 hypothetical protein [Pelotomaculum isophthalicicum JI]OPX92198.1 MAG: hypothetical protein A4E52_00064 [Pelotomaculum sp. PtaB.Bin013]